MDRKKFDILRQGLLWERFYREDADRDPATQPTPKQFCPSFPHLDPDFDQALNDYSLVHERVLEVGCGLGQQAIALARDASLHVWALDVSQTAIKKAQQLLIAESQKCQCELNVTLSNENFITTQLNQKFSVIFDRGCFAVIPPEIRSLYAIKVRQHLEPGGLLFLKVNGATRRQAVLKTFEGILDVKEHKQTSYHSLGEGVLAAQFFVLG